MPGVMLCFFRLEVLVPVAIARYMISTLVSPPRVYTHAKAKIHSGIIVSVRGSIQPG